MTLRALLLTAAMTLMFTAAHAEGLSDKNRADIAALIAKKEAALSDAALKVWTFAEVGYQETKSSALLAGQLEKAGFKIDRGVAGMPTAFVARFKNADGPVIGILAEYDALPGLSQAAVAEKKNGPNPGAAHACGHNLFGAASVAAAITLKEWMTANKVGGEIRVYGSPAEEGGSGKVYLVRAGLFDGVDVVLHWHPDSKNTASQGGSMANISGKFRFRGVASHAAAAPSRGRSALDGVGVMNIATEYLREHVPDGTRIHYVITNGGSAPNVVPEFAEVYYYVRHHNAVIARDTWQRVLKAAEGAAIATGTTVETEITGGAYSLLPLKSLMGVADRNLRVAARTTWSEAEQTFAKTIAASLTPAPAKSVDLNPNLVDNAVFGEGTDGSTDVGDVSWAVPTVGVRTMTWVPGTAAHSWQAAAASGTGVGVKGAIVAAETLALTGAELLTSPETIKAAKDEFIAARGADFTYNAMVGDRTPPLDYRKPAKP